MRESDNWQPLADALGFANEEEMLKNLYVMQEFSLSQLRQILGYSVWSIRRRLVIYGVPLRKRGGAESRLGRRRLKHLTDTELLETPAVKIAAKYQLHPSTVWAEIRFREKEKADAVRAHYASLGIPIVRPENEVPHGSSPVPGKR